ncbi:MAG: methylated-DNA--[protein]-cysteine S-methyltransferase [Promethearchaeota archaeon]
MKFYYFKLKILDLYILIFYYFSEEKNQVLLKRIFYCKNQEEIDKKTKKISRDHLKELSTPQEQEILLKLSNLIDSYFSGINIDLLAAIKQINVSFNLKELFPTEFSQKVMKILSEIKFGERITYSEIGEKINSKAYQAIGNVLKNNPLPLIFPCHRVIRKDGKIGGFMGSTKKSWETDLKKKLLNLERNPDL